MFSLFKCKHKWHTVAIDSGIEWYYKRDPQTSFSHILLYQVCSCCGERRMEYDDPTEGGRSYAKEGNTTVAKLRSKWIHASYIRSPKDPKEITYVDPEYAPLRGFEEWAKAFKKDDEMSELLKHKMVEDALGQLEVAVKLHLNNQSQDKK